MMYCSKKSIMRAMALSIATAGISLPIYAADEVPGTPGQSMPNTHNATDKDGMNNTQTPATPATTDVPGTAGQSTPNTHNMPGDTTAGNRMGTNTGPAMNVGTTNNGNMNTGTTNTNTMNTADIKTDTMSNRTPAFELPAGITPKNLNEGRDIRNTLEGVCDDALTKNKLDNAAGYLVNFDRDRINKDMKDNKITMDDINAQVAIIQDAFKAKYNQTLNFDGAVVFGDQFATIKEGEISDPTQLAGHWPLTNLDPRMINSAMPANGVGAAGASQLQNNKYFGGSTKLDKNRNVAIVQIPTSHGLGALNISLIHELPDSWRLDIPDTISGQAFHDNVLKTLTYIAGHQDKWPADVNEAYRHMGHAILGSVYGITPGAGEITREALDK